MTEERTGYITDAHALDDHSSDKQGFQSPNYTQVPNDLFDSLMSEMSDAELRVTLAIIRQTIGYHREQVSFSIAKIMQMTGLSRNGVKAGTEAAEKRGTLERLNPNDIHSAEWRLTVQPVTPSASDPPPPQPVTPTPSASDPQLGLNKDKENKYIIKSANQKVDAILENERIAQDKLTSGKSWPGRERIPEPIRDLLDVFVQLTGQRPTKGMLMDWLSTGQEWLDLGICKLDLENAHKKSKGDEKGCGGFVVGRPGSLTNTANMFAGQRRTSGGGLQGYERILAQLESING